MKEYELNYNNNFIDGYYLSDLSICDNLIEYFETSKNKILGETGQGVDKKIKDSLDLPLKTNNLTKDLHSYFKELSKIINLYKKKYKFCDEKISQWGVKKILIFKNINHHKLITVGIVKEVIYIPLKDILFL